MSSNSLKFLSSGEHMVSKTPHVLLDNNNGSDFNAEQISLWNLIPNSKDIIPIHKMLNPSSNHTKGYNTMTKIRFNKTNIENLKPQEKRYRVYSDEVKGLYVEVLTSGRKAFRVLYKVNYISYTHQLGVYPVMTPTYAVKRAMEVLTSVSKGNNPQLDKIKKREELTFKEYFIERFLPLQLDRRFSKEEFTINDEGRIKWRKGVQKKIYNLTDGYNAHFRFAKFINKKVSDITEEDVILFSKQITKSHIHNRLMKELSRFFNTTSLNVNPVRRALATDIQLRPTKARTVKAKPEEVIAIGKSLELIKNGYMQDNGYYYQPQPQQVNIIKILLFEGLRPNEVYKMEWSMVNESGVYDTDTKTGEKTIPLTKQSLNILSTIEKKSKFVFPSPTNNDQHIKSIRKIWTKVLELSGVNPELRIYDLRNTFSSKASMMFGTWVSSKLTNHTNSRTVEKHYSDLDSGERVSRKNEVAETFENLLQGGGKVVQIK